ncbi:MAG: glucans biosynthesis glucosyltransferase MdoH [Pseudomonadota bacterium]
MAKADTRQGRRARQRIVLRRALVLGLNLGTVAALFTAMVALIAPGGITLLEAAMLALYALTLPWLAIGFWNAVIGFALTWARDPAGLVNPAVARADTTAPITTRTAIVMALRNEAPEKVFERLQTLQADLARRAPGRFAFHVLSDTSDPAIAAREEAAFAIWRARAGAAVHYRRRPENHGYKAGNVMEFARRAAGRYDFMLPFDADSTMSGPAVLRLVRILQAAPEIGILQGLVVGSPAESFFTRAFQFGMRHGMRAFTLGSAWWQADCGPYWGHNALIRLAPFAAHCDLPVLPGQGVLSGHILSHDQVEAALMRRAGYEVRVLAEEDESYEANPPSLPDFIKRELRWCRGNMQYFQLLALPGLPVTTRVQLALAILMYLSAPAWMGVILLGAAMAVTQDMSGVSVIAGLSLFAVIMALNLMPKLMGLAQVLARRDAAARYGGRARVALGGAVEIAFSILTAPAVAFALALCCLGLLFGRGLDWDAQQRDPRRLGWAEAARSLWPQTLFGLGLGALLAATAPWALAFGAPVVLSLSAAVPLAVLSTLPGPGAFSRRTGLFDIPEDRAAPPPAAPTAIPEAA